MALGQVHHNVLVPPSVLAIIVLIGCKRLPFHHSPTDRRRLPEQGKPRQVRIQVCIVAHDVGQRRLLFTAAVSRFILPARAVDVPCMLSSLLMVKDYREVPHHALPHVGRNREKEKSHWK